MSVFRTKLSGLLTATLNEISGNTGRLVSVGARQCSSFNMAKNELAYANGSTFPALTPDTLRLYSMRFCPFAQRTRLVLEYKKIPHETININLKRKPDWFRLRNPIGLVPVLERNERVVYESRMCGEYLDDLYPDPPLYPTDPYQRARDKMLEEVFGKVIDCFYKLLHSKGADERAGKKLLRASLIYEDALRERGDFFGGSKPCMVDFSVWPWFERMPALELMAPEYSITKDKYPNIAAWIERMKSRPEVKLTMFDTESHLKFLMSLGAGNPNYDIGLEAVQSRL